MTTTYIGRTARQLGMESLSFGRESVRHGGEATCPTTAMMGSGGGVVSPATLLVSLERRRASMPYREVEMAWGKGCPFLISPLIRGNEVADLIPAREHCGAGLPFLFQGKGIEVAQEKRTPFDEAVP